MTRNAPFEISMKHILNTYQIYRNKVSRGRKGKDDVLLLASVWRHESIRWDAVNGGDESRVRPKVGLHVLEYLHTDASSMFVC